MVAGCGCAPAVVVGRHETAVGLGLRRRILEAVVELAPVEDPVVLLLEVRLHRAALLRPRHPDLLAAEPWVVRRLLDVVLGLSAGRAGVGAG